MSVLSLSVARKPLLYAIEGHSIAFQLADRMGFSALPPDPVEDTKFKSAQFSSVLIPDSGLPNLPERAATLDAYVTTDVMPVLLCLIGVNDQIRGGSNAAVFLAAYASYLDARIAAGWHVALVTDTPSTQSGFTAWRSTVRATELTWVGTHCHGIIDIGGDATYGVDAAATDAAKYGDGLHPEIATQDYFTINYLMPYLAAHWPV